jgi:hypothetical protein
LINADAEKEVRKPKERCLTQVSATIAIPATNFVAFCQKLHVVVFAARQTARNRPQTCSV